MTDKRAERRRKLATAAFNEARDMGVAIVQAFLSADGDVVAEVEDELTDHPGSHCMIPNVASVLVTLCTSLAVSAGATHMVLEVRGAEPPDKTADRHAANAALIGGPSFLDYYDADLCFRIIGPMAACAAESCKILAPEDPAAPLRAFLTAPSQFVPET